MTSDEAQMKQCPFIIKTPNINGEELLCTGINCMAWDYEFQNSSGCFIADSGYCKRLTKKK